jgi:hypothetical protein
MSQHREVVGSLFGCVWRCLVYLFETVRIEVRFCLIVRYVFLVVSSHHNLQADGVEVYGRRTSTLREHRSTQTMVSASEALRRP